MYCTKEYAAKFVCELCRIRDKILREIEKISRCCRQVTFEEDIDSELVETRGREVSSLRDHMVEIASTAKEVMHLDDRERT